MCGRKRRTPRYQCRRGGDARYRSRGGFQEQVTGLLDGGADAIFFETFLDYDELELALGAKMKLSKAPTICSMACESEGRLSSGLTLVEAFRKLTAQGADVVGVNCLNGPQATVHLLERIPLEFLLSAYPNAGYPKYHEGRFIYYPRRTISRRWLARW